MTTETTETTERVPTLNILPAELAKMRTSVSRRLALFSVLAFLLPAFGPAFLEWLAPAGMSAGAASWWLILATAEALSRFEMSMSQHFSQMVVVVGCCIAYLLVLTVNQTLSCAELMVNTELSPVEKFEKARKGCLVLKRSLIFFIVTYCALIVLTLISLAYKLSVFPDFEPLDYSTVLIVAAPIVVGLATMSPLFSFLIPHPLRSLVDSNVNSADVCSALSALGDQNWSEGKVSFLSYPSIYFYWLSKKENMLDKWSSIEGCQEYIENTQTKVQQSLA